MGCCGKGESNAPVIYGKVLPVSGKYIPPEKCRQMITEVVKEQVAEIEDDITTKITPRVSSLNDTALVSGTIVEAVGVPTYVDDVTAYADFGITEKGWYVFARVKGEKDVKVTAQTTVEGAASYIATAGEDHVDVAVRFEVASMSKVVVINWDGVNVDTYVFKATDLAVRNMDYRVTFYMYDADPYAKWSYKKTTDATISATKTYYTKTDGEYVKADVTAGEAVPAPYYVAAPAYELTTDSRFAEDTNYYIKQGDEYVRVNVTIGDPVAADTYYVETTAYVSAEGGIFEDGTTYYTLEANVYVPAEVTVGDAIPAFYEHSKLTFEGMVKNITYRFNQVIDCPVEFILPEVTDEKHGYWFEIRCLFGGTYSMTLVPPSPDVKIATEHTQQEQKGINMINLLYTSIGDEKIWRFMNTRSTIPS